MGASPRDDYIFTLHVGRTLAAVVQGLRIATAATPLRNDYYFSLCQCRGRRPRRPAEQGLRIATAATPLRNDQDFGLRHCRELITR